MMDDLDNKHILTGLFDGFWKPIFATLKGRNPKLHLIAEQWDWGDGGDFLRRGGVDAAFAFPLTSAIRSFDKTRIVRAIDQLDKAIPAGKTELVFVENHDMARIASDPGITPEKLRTAATLMTLLEGTPSIYYGQELGMRGTPREIQSDEREIGVREAFEWDAKVEAPYAAIWYKGPKNYWTERFAKDKDGVSVAEQDADPGSLLNHYRRLLKLRASDSVFRSGTQRVIPTNGELLIIERADAGGKALIVANLSGEAAEYLVSGRDLLSGSRIDGVHLQPYQTAVIRP
jgi:glycosidase